MILVPAPDAPRLERPLFLSRVPAGLQWEFYGPMFVENWTPACLLLRRITSTAASTSTSISSSTASRPSSFASRASR